MPRTLSFRSVPLPSPAPIARVITVALLAQLAVPCEAAAGVKYVVSGTIREHLEKTTDAYGLCRKVGVSMGALVLFQPAGSPGVGVYWDRASDRFVLYPGSSGCVVWKRKGAV